jgi:hypothetical protein
MATRPTDFIEWEPANPADILEPSAPEKAAGWQASDIPPYTYFNWFWNLVWLWLEYIDYTIETGRLKTTGYKYATEPTLEYVITTTGGGWRTSVGTPVYDDTTTPPHVTKVPGGASDPVLYYSISEMFPNNEDIAGTCYTLETLGLYARSAASATVTLQTIRTKRDGSTAWAAVGAPVTIASTPAYTLGEEILSLVIDPLYAYALKLTIGAFAFGSTGDTAASLVFVTLKKARVE